ncbi:MAG: sulfite exporter TauE/SafE family protein [Deltaproteobacteria bacterium]|nr:sulfite exporter TauE/SafE family protein [Deltaproteobacteria bacterium]
MNSYMLLLVVSGIVVGIGASFTGLGGGFLMIPLLLFMGYSAQTAVGTSFLAILIISISAGGIIGAQIGARLVEHVSTANFKKIFALILVGLAVYLFVKK